MPEQRRPIFREESLEKLSSPDRLDQLMRVIKPQGWIILLALSIGIALAVVWSFVGTIPATANGTAVLIHPTRLVNFQSPGNGQLASIDVRVGQDVRAEDVLATIKIPDLEKEIELEVDRFEHFEERRERILALEKERVKEEKELIERRRILIGERKGLIEERIAEIERDAERFLSEAIGYVTSQLETVEASSTLTTELGDELADLQERYESLKEVELEGLGKVKIVDDVQVLDAKSRTIANKLEGMQFADRAQGLALEEFKTEQAYKERLEKVRDLVIELKDLEIELEDLKLEASQLTSSLERLQLDLDAEREEIRRRISQLQSYKENETQVRAKFNGKIVEITAIEGQQVTVGQRLGKLEKEVETELRALAYFDLKDGKKINTGQDIRISPATVQRERFGGIRGEIVRVSSYPVSTEAAASEIGNLEMARSLLRGENRIEVEAVLNTAPTPTGFDWTSGQGPPEPEKRPTAGTTASVRVTIEERTPITLILPFLKGMFGLE